VGSRAPGWIDDAMSERAVAEAGVFDPPRVAQLWRKCRATGGSGQFSNADNMALVGVLSTQLLHALLIARPVTFDPVRPRTLVDRVTAAPPSGPGPERALSPLRG
jgi:asparagine synthase (glutamine-hydrolysing)